MNRPVTPDMDAVCRVVEGLLRRAGFDQIEVAQDGKTALNRMLTSGFDIIICDWEMEPMSGLEVLNRVRRHPRTKAIPFILMSAKKEPRWVLEAMQAGANCLLAKPFDSATLKAKIAQVGGVPEAVS